MPKGNWREFNNSLATVRINKSVSSEVKSARDVHVQRTKTGKGGKTVTVIKGLNLDLSEAKSLLKKLKSSCGTGGTIKEDVLELQGDQVSVLLEILRKEGYRPKRSGG